VIDQIASGVREIILPDWTLPRGIMHAVFPSRRGLSPAIRSLIDFLTLEFRGLMNTDILT
jgi:DNA-binding transcriptional LysR family regulator